MSELGIPRRLGHIWVGSNPAPVEWMNTWRDFHPDWEYTLYDNYFLRNFDFKTRRQIEEYMKRGQYPGVADLMRLEILYEFGGFMPGADSVCLMNTDSLFSGSNIYTVYENELVRGRLVSPIQAAPKGHDFLAEMINRLSKILPGDLDEPWITTGNLFLTEMIEELCPDIVVFPSHYFIPVHYTGVMYRGDGPVYAKQIFGNTRGVYEKSSIIKRICRLYDKRKKILYKNKRRAELADKKNAIFDSYRA